MLASIAVDNELDLEQEVAPISVLAEMFMIHILQNDKLFVQRL